MAFPFRESCDPAILLSLLANMSEDGRAEFLENAVNKEDEFEDQSQVASTQEGMIQRFKTMRARFVRPGGIFGEQVFAGNLSVGSLSLGDAKLKSDVKSLRDLKPMTGHELELGTTHKGRYLCGWVAIDDAFFGIASSSLLLEDVTGYLVEIAAYGLVDTELPPHERQRLLTRRFPKGQAIVVVEPYYKVRLDGTKGIRVEESNEIFPWQGVPTDLMSWKNLGNEFFSVLNTQNGGRGALACYQRAIQVAEAEVHTLVMLLNNIATCRFKMGDYAASIQLSGAAVHLEPTYFKGWLRLVSALIEYKSQSHKTIKVYSGSLAARVVSYAHRVSPHMSVQELQILENIVKEDILLATADHERFNSHAEWCVGLSSSGFAIVEEGLRKEMKTVDAWRKEGSVSFAKGDFEAAEEIYRKGVAAASSLSQNVSVVLNNIAAVHLMLSQKFCNETGSCGNFAKSNAMLPSIEAALLNCTVAGIIAPLNYKAWLRRARCLQNLGDTQETCVKDLQEIRTSITSKSRQTKRLNEFKRSMDADIHHRLRLTTTPKSSQESSGVSMDSPRKQRHECFLNESSGVKTPPSSAQIVEESETIDEYIARVEGFVNRTRLAFAMSRSQSNPRLQQLPVEIMMFLTNPPPQIHTEFPNLRGWPEGIDSTLARKVIYRTYLDACMNPWVTAHSMRDGTYFEDINFGDKVKRWHGMGAMLILQARDTVRYGDIIDGRKAQGGYIPKYGTRIRSNFANNPSRAEVYYFGSTHVAIGFVDFSGLLCAQLRNNSNTDAPLRFVGYEMSEFVVAKCKVVAHMLGSPCVPISSVMEVWFSSTWSEATLKNFRDSVNAVLTSLCGQNENPKVMSYLSHWLSAETISAAKAWSEFFTNLERSYKIDLPPLYCFRRQIDRLDLTQYMLTGEIRASSDVMTLVEKEQPGVTNSRTQAVETESTTSVKLASKKKRNRKKKKTAPKESASTPSSTSLVGSLAMWNVPPGSPPLQEDIVFNGVDFMILVESYIEREKKQKHSTNRLSVVDLFIIHIMKNLHRLRELMLTNKLTIEVNYEIVNAANQELLTRIAKLHPDTMSWTNVIDYLLPEDFHDLARRCSMCGGCVHYGYSMNWPTQVFGASFIDYNSADTKVVIDAVLNSALGLSSDPGLPLSSVVAMCKMVGLDKLLFLPFREHLLNGTAYVLAQIFYDEWRDHFMERGQPTAKVLQQLGEFCTVFNCRLQMGAMDLSIPSPLYRSSLTLHMSWCYDPNVRMIHENYPLGASAVYDTGILAQLMARM